MNTKTTPAAPARKKRVTSKSVAAEVTGSSKPDPRATLRKLYNLEQELAPLLKQQKDLTKLLKEAVQADGEVTTFVKGDEGRINLVANETWVTRKSSSIDLDKLAAFNGVGIAGVLSIAKVTASDVVSAFGKEAKEHSLVEGKGTESKKFYHGVKK